MAIFCFDFDGTIADSMALEEKYYLPLFEAHGIAGVRSMNDLKIACRDNYYQYFGERGVSLQMLEGLSDLYEAALKENDEILPLFDGAETMLKSLAVNNSVYILSLNAESEISRSLGTELQQCISGIYGWETCRNKVESLTKVKEKHPEERIILISDSVGDMKEGREAEADELIAVSFGWGMKEDLAEAGADRIFDDIASLFDYLKTQQ